VSRAVAAAVSSNADSPASAYRRCITIVSAAAAVGLVGFVDDGVGSLGLMMVMTMMVLRTVMVVCPRTLHHSPPLSSS